MLGAAGQKAARRAARQAAHLQAVTARQLAKRQAIAQRRSGSSGIGHKLTPLIGTPPFPAPPGTAWVVKHGKARLIIPGGRLAKKAIHKQLVESGVIGKPQRPVASPLPETIYPSGYPTPASGPEAGVVSQGAPGYPPGYVDPMAPYGYGPYGTSSDYLPAQLPSDLLPMPDYLEPGEGSDFPEDTDEDPVSSVPPPGGNLFERSVYGTTHVPSDYAQLYQAGEGQGDSWEGGDEGTLFPSVPDTDEEYQRQSAALDDLESDDFYGGAFNDGLAGISDVLGGLASYWKEKWDSAVAYFEARVGEFMGLKEKLLAARDAIGIMQTKIEHSTTVPENLSVQLRALAEDNKSLIEKQNSLEGDIAGVARQIGAVKQQEKEAAAQLGIIPLVIGAAAVAAVVGVAGAVLYHMQSVKSHLADLEALKAKILTPAELSAVNAATGGGMFADLFKGIGGLIAIGGIAYLILSYKKRS